MRLQPRQNLIGKYFQVGKIQGKGQQTPITISKQLEQILSNIRLARNIEGLSAILAKAVENNGFTTSDNVTYKYDGFELRVGLRLYLDDLADNLNLLDNLQIDSTPRLVEYICIDDAHSLLVTYFPQCNTQEFFPYKYAVSDVRPEAKVRFMDNMRKLITGGLINDYALFGTAHWFVNLSTGEMVINSWDSLRRIASNEDRDNILQALKIMVDKGYRN